MEAFTKIRRAALEKRDKAIARARSDYAETLTRIAALEQDLLGKEPSTHRTISSCINSVLPSERPFTTVDVLAGLEALDHGRVWRKRAVDSHISRLRARGVVRRLSKARGTEPAVYVRSGVEVAPRPFEDMTLAEVVGAVLVGRTLSQTEMAVAMIEAGYQTTMGPKALRDAVGRVLRGDRKRFRRRDGKWVLRFPHLS